MCIRDSLSVGQTYFIRVYDFTGVGNPPTSWNLDLCVSGFEPSEPPTIEMVHPLGGENLEAGTVLPIAVNVTGVIAGKELAFSPDNGQNWEIIWESSSPNPMFQYHWFVPSINTSQGLIRATVFQAGEAFTSTTDTTFSITTTENPSFGLNPEIAHLYWPFYNPTIFSNSDLIYLVNGKIRRKVY